MKKNTSNALLTAAFVATTAMFPLPILATGEHEGHHGKPIVSADSTKVEGVVKKVDKAAGNVTLAHGPLTHLNMPAMTMVFRVQDLSSLGQLVPGEKIRFVVEQIDGVLTVVSFEPAK